MNQPGYGYDMIEGYQTQPPFSNLQYPAYTQPSQPANVRPNLPGQRHGDSVQQSYDYNRNIIPGLGLGFAPNDTGQREPWARPQLGEGYSAPEPLSSGGQTSSQVVLQAGHSKRSNPVAASGSQSEDGSEEGEVSEDEAEDLYEPPGTEGHGNPVEAQVWPFDRAGTDTGDAALESQDILMTEAASRSQAIVPGAGWRRGPPGLSSAGRERSGSYSPYLSPREIDHVEPAQILAHQGKQLVSFSAAVSSHLYANRAMSRLIWRP